MAYLPLTDGECFDLNHDKFSRKTCGSSCAVVWDEGEEASSQGQCRPSANFCRSCWSSLLAFFPHFPPPKIAALYNRSRWFAQPPRRYRTANGGAPSLPSSPIAERSCSSFLWVYGGIGKHLFPDIFLYLFWGWEMSPASWTTSILP